MNVLIITNMQPFVQRAADEIAFNLEQHLLRNGHMTEIMRIPVNNDPLDKIPSQMLMCSQLLMCGHISKFYVEKVIALEFPSLLFAHHNKSVWLANYIDEADSMPNNLKSMIHNANKKALEASHKVFSGSDMIEKSLLKNESICSNVLIPPCTEDTASWDNIIGELLS